MFNFLKILLNADNYKGRSYIDTLLSYNILPTITLPTRITDNTATIIDHINIYRPLRHLPNNITSGNLFFDISDHLPNFIIVEGFVKKYDRPFVRIFTEKNTANFKSRISSVSWHDVCACQDANSAYNCFTETFFDLFKQCFPYKTIKKGKIKDKKWLSKGLLISTKHKNRLFRRYCEKPDNEICKLTYIRYRNKLTNIIRKAEQNYYSNLLLMRSSPYRIYGRYIAILWGKMITKKLQS